MTQPAKIYSINLAMAVLDIELEPPLLYPKLVQNFSVLDFKYISSKFRYQVV